MNELNTPALLPAPVSVEIKERQIRSMVDAGIATSWDINAVDQGGGWLADAGQYVFRRNISVEGPCGFYGGLYGPNAWTAEGGLCTMGAASYSHSPLPESVVVGRYCSIGKGLSFLDFAHPTKWLSSSVAFFRPLNVRSTSALSSLVDRLAHENNEDFQRHDFDPKQGLSYPIIEHDVWIGERVSLGMGIRIGTGAVIAAGSVVTRDVPPYAVVAGVPAIVKRLRFEESIVERLLASRWWEYHFADLQQLDVTQPENLLDRLEAMKQSGQLKTWNPPKVNFPDDLIFED